MGTITLPGNFESPLTFSAPLLRSNNAVSFTPSGLDHGLIGGLADDDHTQYVLKSGSLTQITTRNHADLSLLSADDHTQYALLAGRSSGQTLIGGTAASENLTLQSTSHATKGQVIASQDLAVQGNTSANIIFGGSGNATLYTTANAIRLGTGTDPALNFDSLGNFVFNLDTANDTSFNNFIIRGNADTSTNLFRVRDDGLVVLRPVSQTSAPPIGVFDLTSTYALTTGGAVQPVGLGSWVVDNSLVNYTDNMTEDYASVNLTAMSFVTNPKKANQMFHLDGAGGYAYNQSYGGTFVNSTGVMGYNYFSGSQQTKIGRSFWSNPISEGNYGGNVTEIGDYQHFGVSDFRPYSFYGNIYHHAGLAIDTLVKGSDILAIRTKANNSVLGGDVTIGSQYRPVNTLEIIDVSSLGSEIVVDGGMTDTANWIEGTGWAVDSGNSNKAAKNADGTGTLTPAVALTPTVDYLYRITFDIDTWTDGTQTFTAAVDDTITSTAHGLSNGNQVILTTTTTLPAPLTLAYGYYVINSAANTFKLSATSGGAAVNITDTGTGTHTWTLYNPQSSITVVFGGVTNIIRLAEFWKSFLKTATAQNFIFDIKATSTGDLSFTPSNTSRFNLDTVSIKQILGGDVYVNRDIIFNADVGTKIGTATTQKLAFYNPAPVDQPAALT